jgi:glycosyltransferase involved in cell wall biosynthesis
MRIAFLNPIGTLGGAEQALLEALAELRQADTALDAHLIAGTDGPLLPAAERLGVTCHRLFMAPELARMGDSALALRAGGRLPALVGWVRRNGWTVRATATYAARLRRLLRKFAPDLIHCNGLKSDVLSRVVRPPGVPVVWYVHDFVGARPLAGRLLRWAARGVNLVLANSHAVAADLRAILSGAPVEVFYNGIDMDTFSPGPGDGPRLDALAGLPPAPAGTLRVGLVATYARWKGHEVLLRAAAKLTADEPALAVRYYLVGGPIYHTAGSQFSESELRGLIGQLGLNDRVGLVPFQQDTAAVYRALDVVVHASTKPEPFGRTIVEAMACGRPVVIAYAGGAAEIIDPGRDALGTPPGDATGLADALHTLARDRALRARLAEQARRSVVERFARVRMGRELWDHYRRVLDRSHYWLRQAINNYQADK